MRQSNSIPSYVEPEARMLFGIESLRSVNHQVEHPRRTHYSSDEESESEGPQYVMFMRPRFVNERLHVDFTPILLPQVLLGLLMILSILGVNMRIGVHSLIQEVCPWIRRHRIRTSRPRVYRRLQYRLDT